MKKNYDGITAMFEQKPLPKKRGPKASPMSKKQFNCMLPGETIELIRWLADINGKSQSFIIIKALDEFVEDKK